MRFLPPYPPWTFADPAIIIFYSHAFCSLDSERSLLKTPLAFVSPLFKLYSHVLLFFCKACLPVLGIPRERWTYFLHLPGCRLSWVYCICLTWSVTCLPLAEGCQLQSPFEDPSSSPNSSLTFPPFDLISTPPPSPFGDWTGSPTHLAITTQAV